MFNSMPRTMLETLVTRVHGRDYEQECGYPTIISIPAYHRAYKRNGLCQRIIHLMPDECAQLTPEITEKDSDDEETEWEKTFKDHAEKVNLWHYIQEADRAAGIGRFGVLLIGLSDGQKLDQPVRLGGQLEVIYMRVFSERYATVLAYEQDPTNPRFGKPTKYQLTVNDCSDDSPTIGESMPAATQTLEVHWSRVLHLSDSGEVFSAPRLEKTWNWSQVDLSKLVGGANEMFWRGAFPGFFFSVDPSVDMEDPERQTALKTSAFNYFNTLTRAMHMQGVTVQQLNPIIADPTSQFNILLQLCAISENCPVPVFTGAQPGGLSADSGLRGSDEWSLRKQCRRERYLLPKVVRVYIDLMMDYGVLPPAEYAAAYLDPHTLTDAEKAQNALNWIRTISEYISKGCDVLLSPMSFLTEICGMEPARARRIMESLEAYVAEVQAQEEEEQAEQEEEEQAEQEAAMAEQQAEQEAAMAEQQAEAPPEDQTGTGEAPAGKPGVPAAKAGVPSPAVPLTPAPKKFMVITNAGAYGKCPKCGGACDTRERRKNGNDCCVNGHVYPSKDAVMD